MNKKRLWILLSCALVLVTVISCIIACVGCAGKDDGDTAGGESSLVISYTWKGLRDYDLKLTDTSYDYGVTVTGVDGLFYDVTVDDSLVNYGKQGVYTVKFSVGNETKTQTVKVYGQPSMDVVNMVSEFSYSQIVDRASVNGLFSFVNAVDCFGNAIPVGVENGQSLDALYNADGSVAYGLHQVNIVAVDPSGQIARQSVQFTVNENNATKPTATIETTGKGIAVVEDVKTLSVDLKSLELMAVSVNGYVLDEDLVNFDYSANANNLTLTLKNLDTLVYGENNTIRVMTVGGYSDIEIYACLHESYTSGLCDECGLPCNHAKYSSGVCVNCDYVCPHEIYANGNCSDCSMPCPPHLHDYSNEICSICGVKQILFAKGVDAELKDGDIIYTISEGRQDVGFKNRDKKKWLSFDFKMNSSFGYAYIQPFCSMDSPYQIAMNNLCIMNKATGAIITPTEALWTGENVLENDTWYSVLVNTNNADFLFKIWWEETGTTTLANVKFLDIVTRAGDTLTVSRVDGQTVYTLNKYLNYGSANYDQSNAFWFTTGEAETLNFDFYSEDFDYFQLCSGSGTSYSNFDVYNKVTIVNIATGQEVQLDKDADGGVWTGNVLPKGAWLRVTVEVKGISDLGIVFWAGESGVAHIKNINFVS